MSESDSTHPSVAGEAGMWSGLVRLPAPAKKKPQAEHFPPGNPVPDGPPVTTRRYAKKSFRELRDTVMAAGLPDPYLAYIGHRAGAARRGLGFSLTFEQWWWLWEPHYANRGNLKHQMCMCRLRDQGGYEVGNVRIATGAHNLQEKALFARESAAARPESVKEALFRVNNGIPLANCYERAAEKWLTAQPRP